MSQADVIKEYLVGLGFEVDDSSYSKFREGIEGAGLLVAAVGATVIGLSNEVRDFVGGVAKDLDSLSDFSKLVKVDAQAVEEFEYAASLLDSTGEAARASIKGVSLQLGNAAAGWPRAIKIFQRLGLSFRDNNGHVKTAIELFGDVREKIKDLARPEQLAFLSKLGIDPTLLRTIVEDWSDLREELQKINAVIGMSKQQAADLGSDYDDASKKLAKVIDVLRQAVAVKLMPDLMKRFDAIRKWIVEHADDIVSWSVWAMTKVLDAAKFGFDLAVQMIGAIRFAVAFVKQLNEETGGWLFTLGKVYAAWKLWNSEIANSPTGQILKLVTLFGLLLDDYKVFKAGGTSAIDWDSWFGWAIIKTGEAIVAWQAFKAVVSSVLSVLWDVGKFLFFFWAGSKFFNWLVKATEGLRYINTIAKGLRLFFLLDDFAIFAFFLIPAAIAGLIALAYWLGVFDKEGWENALEGYSKFFKWLEGKIFDAGSIFADWAGHGAQAIIDAFEGVKTWFSDWFVWLRERMPSVPSLGDVFGGGTPALALAPSPSRAAQLRAGANVTVNNQTDINIQSTDPGAAGRSAAREQDGVFARQQRGLAQMTQ